MGSQLSHDILGSRNTSIKKQIAVVNNLFNSQVTAPHEYSSASPQL